MDRRTRAILGKRGRRNTIPELMEAQERRILAKRSRTTEAEDEDGGSQASAVEPSTARPRIGLLTPESSALLESHVAPADSNDVAPTQAFPFMRLPAELRIHVYHMALQRDEPLLLHADRAPEKSEISEDGMISKPSFQPPNFGEAPRLRGHSLPPVRTPLNDPIVPQILRLNKLIYKEARQVLYSDNVFTLSLVSGIHTLSTLHQRSRSLIKHVVLTIPSHHDILDGFADLVRLGLRYCWGLKSFKIILQASLPDEGRVSGATSVYANAFHILRWLPRGCSVVLEGNVSDTVKQVVTEEGRLQNVLDETSYLKRQHQMPERH